MLQDWRKTETERRKGQRMSKEWGNGLMADSQLGWDWFVINLDDDTTLSLKRMRDNVELPYIYGTLSSIDGKVISLKSEDIAITPLNNVELDNGRVMPMAWRITIEKMAQEKMAQGKMALE